MGYLGGRKTKKRHVRNFTKGDIVIIPVPFTDNEGYKLRPAVVISNDSVHETGDIMIVQITSKHKQSIGITNLHIKSLCPTSSFPPELLSGWQAGLEEEGWEISVVHN